MFPVSLENGENVADIILNGSQAMRGVSKGEEILTGIKATDTSIHDDKTTIDEESGPVCVS
ncbi:hypothetical protein ES705_28825 [subsurface metagenome]